MLPLIIIGMLMSPENAVHQAKFGALMPNDVSCTLYVTGAVVLSVFSPLMEIFTLLLPDDSHSAMSCLMDTPEETSICFTTVKSAYLAFFIMIVHRPSSPVDL